MIYATQTSSDINPYRANKKQYTFFRVREVLHEKTREKYVTIIDEFNHMRVFHDIKTSHKFFSSDIEFLEAYAYDIFQFPYTIDKSLLKELKENYPEYFI